MGAYPPSQTQTKLTSSDWNPPPREASSARGPFPEQKFHPEQDNLGDVRPVHTDRY